MSLMVYILCSTANHPRFRHRCLITKSNLLREDVKGWESIRLKRDNGNCRADYCEVPAKGLYELLSCVKYSSDIWHLNLWKALLLTVLMVFTQNPFWNYCPLVDISRCTFFPYQMTVCDNQYRIFTTPQDRSVERDESLHVEVIFWIVESAPIRIKLILLPNDTRVIKYSAATTPW